MRDPYVIVEQPLVTEKSMANSQVGKYMFRVCKNANKIEIAAAIKEIFKVDVLSVNTMNVKGKKKKVGRFPEGKCPDWKKAIVTIKPGQKIEIFEGA